MLREPFDVVLVDDAEEVRALIGMRLRLSRRFVVVGEGRTGEEAIALAAMHRPALLVLDASMPGLDGLEALPAIRAAAPSTAVVMFSGFGGSSLAKTALDLGAAAFIDKATSIDELPGRLLAILGQGEATTSTPSREGEAASSGMDEWRRADRAGGDEDERVLAEHLERFRTVFDQGAIGMATLTLAGTVVRANGALSRLLGETEQHLIGRRYSDLAGPASSRAVDLAVREVAAGERDVADVDHSLAQDDGRRWVHSTLAAVRDAGGRPLYLFAQTQDVTSQLEALDELQASDERFRLLVEGVREYAIFMLDTGGFVTTWNLGAERMKGYRADEIIGQHFSVFYPAEARLRKHPEHELAVAIRQGRYEEEGWRVRKDGSQFWANVVITAVFDHDGNHVGFAKVTRDVTDRRAAADARERAAAELAEANAQLRLAADKTAEFVALTAHELQSPIAAINGAAGILLRHWEDLDRAQLEETLQSIGRGASRITRHLSDLLTASRLDAGSFEFELEDFPLAPVVADAVAEIGPGIGPVELICADGITAHADRNRLVQILTNLVTNAAKYGRPPIAIEAHLVDARAEIRVSDAGPGIPDELVPRLFEKFTRGRSRGERGAGLGLFIVRELARGQLGDAWYERDERGHPCFVVSLPARKVS